MTPPARSRISRWIVAGTLLLAVPATGRERSTIKLRFPPFTLPPGGNSELCVLVRVPAGIPFDLASAEIRHHGIRADFGPQHFLVYLYRGDRLGELAAAAGRIVPSRACLDLGPPDRDQRLLIAGGASVRNRRTMPPGIALRLAPVPAAPGGPPDGLGFVLASEWINRGTRPRRAVTKVILLCRAGFAGRGMAFARATERPTLASDPDPRRSLGSAPYSTSSSNVGTPAVPERTVATRVPGRMPMRTGLTSMPAATRRSRCAARSSTWYEMP